MSSDYEVPTRDLQRQTPLLATKTQPPRLRPATVHRAHLIERLSEGIDGACTLVCAPAGFGKTTLLSSWLTSTSIPAAWVSLEGDDNEPVRFLSYVIAALQTIDSSIGAEALTLLSAPQLTRYESVLALLTNDLTSRVTSDFALVLDDYHVITAASVHQAVIYLVEHSPPQMHLVISTRADPPLPLARLRAHGQLTEVRIADLRFDSEETDEFLRNVMRLSLSPDEVAALQARTEGWIAGLQFAALSLRGRSDSAAFLQAFTGSHRFVLDFLSEEVFAQQPEAVQRFLLQTCLLERLSASLCDALTGEDNGQVMLESLERANMFVLPLDDDRQWYRYHHLFAEVLRSILQQTQPARIPALHLLASAWYEQHGMASEAVGHALAASDFAVAARLIDHYSFEVGGRGHYHTVLGWLDALPEALVRTNARLSLLYAMMLRAANQVDGVEARLQDAERCIRADTPPEQAQLILGWVTAVRGALALFAGEITRCMTLAHQALELLPQAMEPMREIAAAQLTYNYLVSGDVTLGAEQQVRQTVAMLQGSPNLSARVRCLTNLARMQALQGRLTQAVATYEGVARIAPMQEVLLAIAGSAAYYFGLGDLLRERNNLVSAERLILEGMELLEGAATVDADVVTLGHFALARLKQSRGDFPGAVVVLKRYTDLAMARGFAPYLVSQAAALQVRIALAQGNMAASLHWAEAHHSLVFDELRFLNEIEYLTLARAWIAQARYDEPAPSLSDAVSFLDRLLRDAEAKGRMGSALEILLLRALAHHGRGDDTSALTDLERALALAEPEGYIRLFLDEGAPMLDLLRHARSRGLAPDYIASLVAAANEQVTSASSASSQDTSSSAVLPDPLSERELEVLRLLASGASNEQIAEQLVIAVSTVKRHVSNIFAKLTVSNRTQAVARARDISLL